MAALEPMHYFEPNMLQTRKAKTKKVSILEGPSPLKIVFETLQGLILI